ncbi:MAG: 30S ribosomal protein S20 [Chloroflexi bacterium]|nr:MAG: 30S ribosomal protein S20 [Chloroflexota bacterium]
MPNKPSAIKRLRSSKRKQRRNQLHRGRARTAVKKARRLMDQGRLDEAREAVYEAVSALDKAAAKGVIHKNNAARRKSRLMSRLNQMERSV